MPLKSQINIFCNIKILIRKIDIIFFLLFALFFISIAIHLAVFLQSRYAFGADGYYYATQVQTLLEKGRFSIPESSVVLYILTLFSFFGNNIILTNKIATALLGSLIIFPAFLTGKNINNKNTGLALGIITTFNSFTNHFTFEYIKNLAGILVFLFFLNHVLLLLKEDHKKRDLIITVLLFILAIFTHKLIAALAALVLIFALIFIIKDRRKMILSFLILIVILIITAVLFPNTLHLYDLSRLAAFLDPAPRFAPLSYIKIRNLPVPMMPELWIFAAAPVLLIPGRGKRGKHLNLFLIIMLGIYLICLNPFLKFTGSGLGFRIFILIFIPSAVFIAVFFSERKRQMIIIYALIIILVPYKWYTLELYKDTHSLDYELYDHIMLFINLPKGSLLIVHQGFDYFYWYKKKAKAFHYLPEAKHMNRPLYRLAYAVPPGLFKKYMGPDTKASWLPGFYTLMEEKTWQDFLSRLPDKDKKRFMTWRNPHKHRKAYMLRNQKFRKKK